MFGLRRFSPFDDIFGIQQDVDRAFNQFWSDLPARTAAARSDFQVTTADDGWRINLPLPGIDPQYINLEVAGDTLSIRAEVPEGEKGAPVLRYEQTLTVPDFLDTGKLMASHNHGMLQLTLPLRESVKPRKDQIESKGGEPKVLAAGAGAAR
jgi:HSP20 family protein